jgi:hypothetical protein
MRVLILAVLILLNACNDKDAPGPGPEPKPKAFSVQGEHIAVSGSVN